MYWWVALQCRTVPLYGESTVHVWKLRAKTGHERTWEGTIVTTEDRGLASIWRVAPRARSCYTLARARTRHHVTHNRTDHLGRCLQQIDIPRALSLSASCLLSVFVFLSTDTPREWSSEVIAHSSHPARKHDFPTAEAGWEMEDRATLQLWLYNHPDTKVTHVQRR